MGIAAQPSRLGDCGENNGGCIEPDVVPVFGGHHQAVPVASVRRRFFRCRSVGHLMLFFTVMLPLMLCLQLPIRWDLAWKRARQLQIGWDLKQKRPRTQAGTLFCRPGGDVLFQLE